MKTFNVPITYRSPLITALKNKRREEDKMKKDFAPALLELGDLHIYLARHFGFCFGVENAIEISFRTIDENPGKRIFLLSEMIHNPHVNADLRSRGVQFIQDTYGKQLIPFEDLLPGDVVIIPAFGTTLEIERQLKEIGIRTEIYNTTCPFVEKVWNRGAQLAKKEYTVIIHGKPGHEETRATFSHAAAGSPTLVIRDMQEARELAEYIKAAASPDSSILGPSVPDSPSDPAPTPAVLSIDNFFSRFAGQYSADFDPREHLRRIGVVNQTTMLASDTQAIADLLRQTMIDVYGSSVSAVEEYFADTRDTLCYATLDNQSAVNGMLGTPADLAIVVGGYNSSNTSHLVELCEEKLPTYFISSEEKVVSQGEILHYNIHRKIEEKTTHWLPTRGSSNTTSARAGSRTTTNIGASTQAPTRILITSGASCPDALVEAVIRKLASFFGEEGHLDDLIVKWQAGS
jgi:4-hydroxy-3-methylbut-2-en-1-yl diphosphate reductase